MFIDEATIFARGGDGGAGVAAFERLKGKPRGKPIGGSGGSGGHVVIEADAGVASLLDLKRRPHRKAGSGVHGEGDLRHGRQGEDLVIGVPLGTVVRLEDGTMLADLVRPGQRVIVARGGRGGRGNHALIGRRHRSPAFAEQGEYGDEERLTLEVKLIADAALIGFPNAGKSTLISAVSAAKPKIADYPFTTLQPHLGVVDVEGRDFVLADIPGLIEGAASGKGLGHEFLRHAERARVLVVLLDASSVQPDSPQDQYRILTNELADYSPELADRPRVVAVGKSDLEEVTAELDRLAQWGSGEGLELHAVSSVTGAGVRPLLSAILDAVDTVRKTAPDRDGYILHRPAGPGFTVEQVDDMWVLRGRGAERAVNLDDLSSHEAIDYVASRLARAGITQALVDAGAQAGDDVQIGSLLFEFQPDVLVEDGDTEEEET